MAARRAFTIFGVVAILALAVLAGDQYRVRPVQIPAPVEADSLAGVIARLFPFQVDSAFVARVRWYQSPERVLYWADASDYAYRDSTRTGKVPVAARADLKRLTVTFARGAISTGLTKHELVHLALMESGHPAETFRRIEGYRGR